MWSLCAVVGVLFGGTVVATPAASIEIVDSVGDTGQDSSLVLDAAGNPVIAYRDATNGDLRLVHCDDPACAGGETSVTVDASGDTGHEPSLVLDAAGIPVIAHHANSGQAILVLTRCADPACTTWSSSPGLRIRDDSSRYSSVLDAAGNPVIAYTGFVNMSIVRCRHRLRAARWCGSAAL